MNLSETKALLSTIQNIPDEKEFKATYHCKLWMTNLTLDDLQQIPLMETNAAFRMNMKLPEPERILIQSDRSNAIQ